METPSQPQPDDDAPLSEQEFLALLKNDPAFSDALQRSYEAALALPAGPDTEQMHQLARAGLASLKHYQAKRLALEAIMKCRDHIREDINAEAPDTLRKVEQLSSEAIDHLLDVREPERTELVTMAMEFKDLVRKARGR